MALLDKRMLLEEMRLGTARLELEILKAQSEQAGGGPEKLLRGVDSEVHLLTTSKEDDYFVKAAKNWDQWVKLRVSLREHPSRWSPDRIVRQFSEAVMTEVIVSLQLERSSSVKPFPKRLAGFDVKDAKGIYKFFSYGKADFTDFADVIEAFLRINDKEKDGKPIPCSVGMSVTTDSFSIFMEEKRPKAYWKLGIPDVGGIGFLTAFEKLADRFGLPASEMVWDEAQNKWVRLESGPPLSAEVAAREKDHIKLWFKKFLEAFLEDKGPDGMYYWSGTLVKDTKELAAIDGWCRVRDIVKLVYLKHHAEAAKTFANRQTDPRNQKAEVKPVEAARVPAAPAVKTSYKDRKRERELRENEARKQAGGGGGGGGNRREPSDHYGPER